MIQQINARFVATWVLVDAARQRGAAGDEFARTLASQWEFPLDLMFFNAEGTYVNKLNSFYDFQGAHADVGHPPEGRGRAPSHVEVFDRHVDRYFPQAD